MGKALLERGRHEEARAAFERALALGAGSLEAEARNNLAVAHLEAGRLDEARSVLLDLLDRCPFYAPAWLNIGVVDLRSGDAREAVEELERALALDAARWPHAFYNLAAAYGQLGEHGRAIAVLERGVRLWPRSSEAASAPRAPGRAERGVDPPLAEPLHRDAAARSSRAHCPRGMTRCRLART
jgi:tetratricopeptide (TPR) repeat protein